MINTADEFKESLERMIAIVTGATESYDGELKDLQSSLSDYDRRNGLIN